MKSHRIGILDLVTKNPTNSLYARVMNGNLASIMPQAIAVWCEQAGHDVTFVCYTGFENLEEELPTDIDMLIIGAFTQSAQLSYAISNRYRQQGVVTVLGGPHARCYPDDALKYFDYVLGFTGKEILADVLQDCSQHRPLGVHLTAPKQPMELPGVQERWKFIEPTIAKTATSFKVVPMVGSLGCPYTCPFCIDSEVEYQPLSYDQIRDDLRFLRTKVADPIVAWHDPNFGIRFKDYMGVIEDAVPPGSVRFIAESSLAILSEKNVKRMQATGFQAILPGIESWYSLGNKSRTGRKKAMDKVKQVSEHINMIMRYMPYVQVNFVMGLDDDKGPEPFELTKKFLAMTPGAFPAYSLLSAFGEAAPLNLELQRADRVYGFPFHFLNNNHAMNVKPLHYEWNDFYDHVIDLSRFSFSWPRIYRRFRANTMSIPRWLNLVRAVSSEGFGRIKYYTELRRHLDTDRHVRAYFDRETTEVPAFFMDRMKKDLGVWWPYLPEGAIEHDQNAYLKKVEGGQVLADVAS